MSDGPGRDGAEELDLRRLAQDWITLWQSELAAMATDRELQESWQAMLGLWAGAAAAMLRAAPAGPPPAGWQPTQHDRAAATAGPAPAPAPPDPRDAAIERLSHRIAELEARLAEVERGDSSAAHGAGSRPSNGRVPRRRPRGDAAPGRRAD